MWINDKLIDLKDIVKVNGKIIKTENIPNMKGLGDSTILRCTFENGNIYEVEFMPEEYALILKCRRN